MVVSWTLAKSRIAREVRPSWIGAWGPVLVDLALLVLVFVLVWPMLSAFWILYQPSSIWAFIGLFAGVFLPMQIVMITSSLWATRSRYVAETSDG